MPIKQIVSLAAGKGCSSGWTRAMGHSGLVSYYETDFGSARWIPCTPFHEFLKAEIAFYVPLWEKVLQRSLIEIYCFWDYWLKWESTVLCLHRDLLHISKSRKDCGLSESYYRIRSVCFNMYITFRQTQALSSASCLLGELPRGNCSMFPN